MIFEKGVKVKKVFLLVGGVIGFSLLTGCSQGDPSRFDVTSPCVSNPSSIYMDQPCERRLPVDNILQTVIIATS
jgi:hypothetical protein